jgi:heme exporter protein D
MPDFGSHAPYIWSAYALAALVIAALAAWVVLEGRTQSHLIAELEARGVRRRSAADGEQR